MKRDRRSRGLANLQQLSDTKFEKIQVQPKKQRVTAQSFAPAAPAVEDDCANTRTNQLFTLSQHFCAIEKVLYTLNQKKRLPDWETVREGATRFSGSEIKLADIDMIMDVYPAAYQLTWRTVDARRNISELCIKLPHEFLGKLESRSEMFREMLDGWSKLHPGEGLVTVKKTSFPPKPNLLLTSVTSKSARTVSSFLAEVPRLVRIVSEPAYNVVGMTGMESLAQLREKASQRDKSKDVRVAAEMELKKRADAKERMASLPTLCDALRSKCLGENRTRVKTAELIRHLISELSLTPSELSQRLSMISAIVPEFIKVIPADDVVGSSTVQLDLKAPYGSIRRKVIEHIKRANIQSDFADQLTDAAQDIQ